jgi:hypothetical protein
MVTRSVIAIAEPAALAASRDRRPASSHSLIAPEFDASRATILLHHLFSMVYKLLLRQLLSFHIHTNTLGVGSKSERQAKAPRRALIAQPYRVFNHPPFNHW